MALELWKEPTVIAANVLLIIIARATYKRNRITGWLWWVQIQLGMCGHVFDEDRAFRPRDPRATGWIHPDEVPEEREIGGEPYYAVWRRACNARGKVKRNI